MKKILLQQIKPLALVVASILGTVVTMTIPTYHSAFCSGVL